MRLLLDTNVLLEVLLAQKKADEVRKLLLKTGSHAFLISDFSLHSIGVLLIRRKQAEVFQRLLTDLMVNAGVRMVGLDLNDMELVIKATERFQLDFDDAYQYASASKFSLSIVSYDADFDRTDPKRMLPEEIP